MTFKFHGILYLCLLFASNAVAETRYVTDQFEITLRTGTSVSNSILSMLKSGQAVTLLEEDTTTKYSFVQTADGKQGYVLTRYLDKQPSGRERVARLQESNDRQRSQIETLKTELEQYKLAKQNDEAIIGELQSTLNKTETEFSELQSATRDTVRVIKQNESLQNRINDLDNRIKVLTNENAGYKDRTAMDWFIRGAAVSLIAFLLGILVTRIRWKKRDSWGSY
jgi:SH3 domain protein